MELITGYAGRGHVTSAQTGATNASIFGSGQFILNVGNKMEAEKVDNNHVTLDDGYGINQGRFFATTGENLTIETGTSDSKREDLIVARYERANSGVETVTVKVIKGTAGADYTTPSYVEGDILAGDAVDEMILFKVHLNGAEIEEIVQVAELKEGFGSGIELITAAEYEALSEDEKAKKDYLITDLDATPLDASVINYTDSTSVKTALDSLNSSLTYATTETVCGKWIDGKTIYRRVYNTTISTGITTETIAELVNVIDTVVTFSPLIKDINNWIYDGCSIQSSDNYRYVTFNATTGVLHKRMIRADDITYNLQVIIEYTKQ